jgi:hypothetical protein
MNAMPCLNCGAELTGRHCVSCGQSANTGRLKGGDLVQPLVNLLNGDRGWAHTVADLTRRPGAMINDYLAGRRIAYTEPFKYTVSAVALGLLALWLTAPTMPAQSTRTAEAVAAANEVMQRYGNALLLLTVPFLAVASRLLYRARGLNLTEHCVLNAYVFAQQNLFSLPFLLLIMWWPSMYGLIISAYYLLCLAYYVRVLRVVVAGDWWSAALGAAGITALAYMLSWLCFGLLVMAASGS